MTRVAAVLVTLTFAACSSNGGTPADGGIDVAVTAADGGFPSWCPTSPGGVVAYTYQYAGGAILQHCLPFEHAAYATYIRGANGCVFAQSSVLSASGSSSVTLTTNDNIFATPGMTPLTVSIGDANTCLYGNDCNGMSSCTFDVTQAGGDGATIAASLHAPCALSLQVQSPNSDAGSGEGMQLLTLQLQGPLHVVTQGGGPIDASMGCPLPLDGTVKHLLVSRSGSVSGWCV